jgi:flagellar protein FliS
MFAPRTSQANAYSTIQVDTCVEGADPHRLVNLLLDGALNAIVSAYSAMQKGDIAAKGRAISRAVGIIEEGLRGNLDMEKGGQVAATLHDFYTCLLLRLTQANLRNDGALLLECRDLLVPVRDAWNTMEAQKLAA